MTTKNILSFSVELVVMLSVFSAFNYAVLPWVGIPEGMRFFFALVPAAAATYGMRAWFERWHKQG